MAITDIRKLNVRSPYFVEVVDEYINGEPPVEPPVEPDVTLVSMPCSSIFHFGSIVGIYKYSIDAAGKELGVYNFTIAGADVPVKFRVYTEGETPPAYTTIGLDTHAVQWLAATGEDASSLSTVAANPNGVTRDFIYTTDAASTSIGTKIVVDLYAPIPTTGNMSLASVACQPNLAIVQPVSGGFVSVLTLIVKGIYKVASIPTTPNGYFPGIPGTPTDVGITLNGITYPLPNAKFGSGLKLILDDSTPDYTVLTNTRPYTSSNTFQDMEWVYDLGVNERRLIAQELSSSSVNSGTNTLIITSNAYVTYSFDLRIVQHPIETIGGETVIKHLGDGTGTDVLYGFSSNFNLPAMSSLQEQTLTIKFSGVNESNLVAESAIHHHEVPINDGDSMERFDDVLSYFDVKPIYY